MNIYAGILPVVHLIQCVFHSHFLLIYFIPWAPIGNDLFWPCLPSICRKESRLLLPTLQQQITPSLTVSLLPNVAVDQWALHSTPRFYKVKLYSGKKIPTDGMRQNWQVTCGIQGYTCTFFATVTDQHQKRCAFKTCVLGYLKLQKESQQLNFNLESNL